MTAAFVGLGEALLRLAAPGRERLEQVRTLDVEVGGSELNALIAARCLGIEAAWLTRLADNPLGRRIAAHAAAHGVRAEIEWDAGARAPLYFVEPGAGLRPSEVLYDRDGTAMRALRPGGTDWPARARGARAVLSTGITSALGAGAAQVVDELLAGARERGAMTVFDVNHRSRLWSWEEALPVLRRTVAHADVLLASRHDLVRLLDAPDDDVEDLARRAIEAFGARIVLVRASDPTPHGTVRVSAVAVTAEGPEGSPVYEAGVVDAFGAGDAATGAFVATLLAGDDLAAAVDRAAWACAFHHTVPGDAPRIRPSDLAQRSESGRAILR
jgi:2-dehydro-3-deoxygluconokinase